MVSQTHTNYSCDRCGAKSDEDAYGWADMLLEQVDDDQRVGHDICPDCRKSLEAWLHGKATEAVT